jgi:hypothetical protein
VDIDHRDRERRKDFIPFSYVHRSATGSFSRPPEQDAQKKVASAMNAGDRMDLRRFKDRKSGSSDFLEAVPQRERSGSDLGEALFGFHVALVVFERLVVHLAGLVVHALLAVQIA